MKPGREAPGRQSSRPSGSLAWRRHALLLTALWAAALLAYSDSFATGLVNDNGPLILADSRIQAVTSRNLDLIWGQEYWYGNAVSGLYRPLSTLSYLLNYAIFGNAGRPAGYHWVNFALHAGNIALVYLLALLLLKDALLKDA